jgi:hypothetical protein
MSNIKAAIQLAEAGLFIFPVIPFGKTPHKNTSGLLEASSDPKEVERQFKLRGENSNIACSCGPSDLIVIDIDVQEHEILDRLPETYIQRTPKLGWHFVYRQPEGKKIRNIPKGIIAPDVETRGDGGYFLMPPSTVRIGDEIRNYEVVNETYIADCPQFIIDINNANDAKTKKNFAVMPIADRPIVPKWGLARLNAICDRVSFAKEGNRNNILIASAYAAGRIAGAGHISENDAIAAIWNCCSSWPNPRKNKHCIKRGVAAGLENPVYPEKTIRTPTANGYDFSALIEEAEPEVMLPDEEMPDDAIDVELEKTSADLAQDIVEMKQRQALQEDADRWQLLNDFKAIGGLCDAFSSWCLRGATYEQPCLTIGAALCLGSVLGSKLWSWRGVSSNLFIVQLAETGTGKSRPQDCLENALQDSFPHMLGGGTFASAKSLWKNVLTASQKGHGIVSCVDEYGEILSQMLQKKGGSQQELYSWLLKFATANNKSLNWGNSAADGAGIEIAYAPSFTLLGSTTPVSFQKSLCGDSVDDGFLGRHLIMSGLKRIGQKNYKAFGHSSTPADVLQQLLRHKKIRENVTQQQMQEGLLRTESQEIHEERDVEECLIEFDKKIDSLRFANEHQAQAPILARAVELTQKVALAIAVLAQTGETPVVTSQILGVACRVVEMSCNTIFEFSESMTSSTYGKNKKLVERALLDLCGTSGQTTFRELSRSKWLRYFQTTDLEAILIQLELQEIIRQEKKPSSKGGWPIRAIYLVNRMDFRKALRLT